jgi:hypothetical protein
VPPARMARAYLIAAAVRIAVVILLILVDLP